MSEQDDRRLDKARGEPMARRSFLGKAGVGACVAAAGGSLLAVARALVPQAMPDPSQQFKLGPPQDYPPQTMRTFEDDNVVVFRDEDGMYAISTVCTHLGCIVSFDAAEGFDCPCHGSTFDSSGKVTKGPAPSDLPWLEVSILPSGQLAVDKSKKVPKGTKLALA